MPHDRELVDQELGEQMGAAAAVAALHGLRARVAGEGIERFRRWRADIRRPGFAASALNLAHYIALRHHDLRPLQRVLMRCGVSSLGRLEGRVSVTLEAVAAVLAAAAGGERPDPRLWPPPARRFFRGEARLAANAATLFGPAPEGREVRILVTLSREAADDFSHVLGLVQAGADAVRINCAHDDASAWAAMVAHTRAAGVAVGRRVPVLMDIGGPKIRTGEVHRPDDATRLRPGDRLLLLPCAAMLVVPDDIGFRAACEPGSVLESLRVGAEVAMDDGKLGGVVEAVRADGGVAVKVRRTKLGGVKLRPEKGLNFPGTELDLDPLTEKDLSDLDFVAANADLIGYSFVQRAADVSRLQAELAARRPNDWTRIGVIAKIETLRAVQNLPEIVVRAAGRQPFGVMIARGDLAVEIGFARLAEMQEEILWLCEAAHVPVVWATQVLEEMVKSGLPTRGEMTDAAMAARAECVMLNKGPNVGAAVTALDGLLRRMAEHQNKKTSRMRVLHSW
jgi:pyruvate kinase